MQELQNQIQALGRLQRRLLPQELPDLTGWRLAVHHAGGPWPGGDYYDFLPLHDGRVAFVIADASEKGILAMVLVAAVRMALHACPLTSGGGAITAPHSRQPQSH